MLIPLDGCSINPARRCGGVGVGLGPDAGATGLHLTGTLAASRGLSRTLPRCVGLASPHPGVLQPTPTCPALTCTARPPLRTRSFGPALVANRWKDFWGECTTKGS